MRTSLICSDNLRGILMELLSARGVVEDDSADMAIVESGYAIPEGKTALVFDLRNMARLIEIVDKLSRSEEENIDSIVGRYEDRYEIIPAKQACFFEARGNNAFCTTGGKEYRVREKLYELEARLPQSRFIRVNKSVIVNIGCVKEIIPWFGRRLILKFDNCSMEVEVSRNYIKSFKEFIGM